MKIVLPRKKRIKILVIGVGGTGGYLVPHLFRQAYSLAPRERLEGETTEAYKKFKNNAKDIEIILADGDSVESKNLRRQNFTEHDLLKNKAEVLSKRYGGVYGVQTTYIPSYIESADIITEILHTNKNDVFLPVLVGCVDNNQTRGILNEVFAKLKEIIYIDSGNSEFQGQVVMGYKYKNKVILPAPATVYPDLLEVNSPDERFHSLQSCGAAVVSSPQNMMANINAATIIMGYINNITALGTIEISKTVFSAQTMNSRSDYIKDIA